MKRIDQRIDSLAREAPFPVREPEWRRVAGGVVVRMPNWLGDAVMALPALGQFKKLLDSHNIPLYLLTGGASTALVSALPPGFCAKHIALSEIHRPWTDKETAKVRALEANCGILLTNSLRDVLNLRRAGVKILYGARARMRGVLLARSFAFPRRRKHRLNSPHHTLKYLEMAYALGAPEWDGVYPELHPVVPIEQIEPEFAALCDHPNVLLMAAGAAYGAGKRWPSEAFREVAAWQVERGGLALVLGSAGEAAIGEEIVAGLPERKVLNLCGRTGFPDLLFLMRSARAMVANDSGLMHLAAAVGLPGVAIFGPTDYLATGPASDRWTVVSDPERCSPCFGRECKSGRRCIAKVAPDRIIEILKEK